MDDLVIDILDEHGVIMRTKRDDHGVHYKVIVDGETRWYKYVRFGRDRRHRAGGLAFVEAARKQEEVADAARR